MKKTIRILALVMVAAMLCCVLASCGNTLKGTYKADGAFGIGETSYSFDGDKFTYVAGVGALSLTLHGTYTIEDNKITLTLNDGEEDSDGVSGTHEFEKGEDYIKIGGKTYTKAD